MTLLRCYPHVAFRDCDDCLKHVYNENTGAREEYPKGSGLPIVRAKGNQAPCQRGTEKCPKGNPKAGRELEPHNLAAYLHYLECRATGRFPDDPIVARNAGVIRMVEDAIDRADQSMLRATMRGSGKPLGGRP